MASIGSLLPHTSTASAGTAASGGAATTASASSNSNSLASQQTFLQLLVAQLQNQDPTQPVEGTEFVTQLATFSNVEQSVAQRQDLDALSYKYLGSVPSGGTVASSTTTDTSASSGTTSGTTTSGTTSATGG